jgi:hypothetical protein
VQLGLVDAVTLAEGVREAVAVGEGKLVSKHTTSVALSLVAAVASIKVL